MGLLMLQGLDNPTLIVSQLLLSVIYSAVFFFIQRAYPHIKGVRYFTWAYFVVIFARLMFALNLIFKVPLLASAGNCLALMNEAFIYAGLLEHFGDVGFPAIAWGSIAIMTPINVLIAYSRGETIFAAGSAAVSFGLIRTLTVMELYRHAAKSWLIRNFAFFMTFYAVYSINQTVLKLSSVRSAFAVLFPSLPLQTVFLVINVISSSFEGILLFFLVGNAILYGVEQQTLIDPLTQKLNRRAIERKIKEELARSFREGSAFSIAVLDLDHFKSINDTWGHAAGDAALRLVADLIASHTRISDAVGRQGGDELILIMPSTNGDQATFLTEKICELILSSTILDEIHLSASIGVAQSEVSDSPESLIARADIGLYEAKKAGRGCVRYQPLLLHPQGKTLVENGGDVNKRSLPGTVDR